MNNFRKRLDAAVTCWKNSGKSDTELFVTTYDRVRAYLWSFSRGAKIEEVSEDLVEFARENQRAVGDANYNQMLRTREYCSRCGETYRLENLAICVECDNLYCYRCQGQYGIASNSNYLCSCGGELIG